MAAEFIAEHNMDCSLARCGIKATPDGQIGSQAFLYQRYGISAEALVAEGVAMIKKENHKKSGSKSGG